MNPKFLKQDQPKVIFSFHAVQRAQQRGISRTSVILATIYGKKSRVPGGWQRVFTKKSANRARRDGVPIREIEPTVGIPVICDETLEGTRSVITVLTKDHLRRAS